MSLRLIAARNAKSRTVAPQMLKNREDDPNIRCGYTPPQRGHAQAISALSSPDKSEYTSDYTIRGVATAATKIAADLVMTAGSGSPVTYQKSGKFMTSASKRGMALIPRFAEAAARNGFRWTTSVSHRLVSSESRGGGCGSFFAFSPHGSLLY